MRNFLYSKHLVRIISVPQEPKGLSEFQIIRKHALKKLIKPRRYRNFRMSIPGAAFVESHFLDAVLIGKKKVEQSDLPVNQVLYWWMDHLYYQYPSRYLCSF
jgi:hypothetical protein